MDAIEAIKLLKGMRVFVTSRERIKQPEGHDLFDKAIETLEAAESVAQGGEDGEYSQGIMGDGAAILHNGVPMTIDTIVATLNRTTPATGSGEDAA